MSHEFVTRFRDELDARAVGGVAAIVGFLYFVGFERSGVLVIAGMFVLAPIVRAGIDAAGFDVGPVLAKVALAGLFFAFSGGQLVDGASWLGGVLAAVGCWLCLDGIDSWRHRGSVDESSEEEDLSNADVNRYLEYSRWIVEELREIDRPLTPDEIQSRTGLTEDDFERVLELHGESGPIQRVGNAYTIDEDELGTAAFVRYVVGTLGGRLLRPFRLFRPAG